MTVNVMKNQFHTSIYLGSRVIAAILNLSAIAVFTRMAGLELYGLYLLVLAWSFIFHGILTRWISESFFARFSEDQAEEYFNSALWLLAFFFILLYLGALITVSMGIIDTPMVLSVCLMTFGLAVYDFALESSRTRLHAKLSSSTTLLRAVLVITAGSYALANFDHTYAFPISIALAHVCAAIPVMFAYRRLFVALRIPKALGDMWHYGWPLILASGTWALAQNIDRLIVVELVGSDQLGPYGALMDFLKQGFFVFGEVVAISLISLAKRHHSNGETELAHQALIEAMRTITLIAVIGTVFIISVKDVLVPILFGPEFRILVGDLLPILLLANAVLVVRTYYFGQIIYFLHSAWPQVVVSIVQLVVTALLAVFLVPYYGVIGAAFAFLAAQVASCLVISLWRANGFLMPVSLLDVLSIVLIGCGIWYLQNLVQGISLNAWIIAIINTTILVVTAFSISWWYDLFDIRFFARRIRGEADESSR